MFLEYGGDTMRFKYRPFTGVATDLKPEILVLDGQQRLTSVCSAMFSRNPVPTQTVKKEPVERYYYIDIDQCLAGISDRTIDRVDVIFSVPHDRIVRKNFARDVEIDLSSRENIFGSLCTIKAASAGWDCQE
jgi:hypothetical protein